MWTFYATLCDRSRKFWPTFAVFQYLARECWSLLNRCQVRGRYFLGSSKLDQNGSHFFIATWDELSGLLSFASNFFANTWASLTLHEHQFLVPPKTRFSVRITLS